MPPRSPRRAGQVLASVIEPVVPRPVETGYEGDVSFKNDAATLRVTAYAIRLVAETG